MKRIILGSRGCLCKPYSLNSQRTRGGGGGVNFLTHLFYQARNRMVATNNRTKLYTIIAKSHYSILFGFRAGGDGRGGGGEGGCQNDPLSIPTFSKTP